MEINKSRSINSFYNSLIEMIRSDVGTGRTALDMWADAQFKKYGQTMTVQQFADAIGISSQAVRVGIKNGDLPGATLGDGERVKYIIHTAMFVSWVINFGHSPQCEAGKNQSISA